MREHNRSLADFNFDGQWTLFLDRDGVINKKIENDYVRSWDQFEFLPGVLDALNKLSKVFGRIIIVTNQRGIGRGLMTEEELHRIHEKMLEVIRQHGGRIDRIYYCPHDHEKQECDCRKPKPGLALQAKKDFPEIDFQRSVMIGDSESDMIFAKNLGMVAVCICQGNCKEGWDFVFANLQEFSQVIR
ncbi:MAG: HAD family hydrolase [Fervidobacterium sp.]|uniref:D-glycero-alpha-D-manno-heptose-1,7-bisphosphate 7-phosphatase n=1 Tax=Fervidobacterium sp. TaxID=1871331 RepID=UPI0025B8C7F8|nr:HAD family hydrolase [Fervidobacterium sp.]NPU88326.1 HAD family hydrolase [Fervidobacterium sp.]